MRRLIDFYATQLRLLWEWRGGPWSLIWRVALTVTLAAISFGITAWLLPGLAVESAAAATLVVVLLAVFNAVVRPLILAALVPVSLVVTSIAVFVLQFVSFAVACEWTPA